jgi:hypothetical protein
MVDIALKRLSAQQLAGSALKRPADAVAWMGAIQAQDYHGAMWSIGLRMPGITERDVEQAVIEKKIVRSWVMRGTLHFVSPADIGWMIALLAPGIIAGNARRYKELELDERTMTRSNDVIAKALQGGKLLDRPELVAILEKKGISTKGQRTPFLLQRAVMDRLICQGVMRGKNPTFMLLDKKMLKNRFPDPEEAAAELALRYFTSRGPALLQDFIWWSGLSSKEAATALDAIRSKLAQEIVEGKPYWFSRTKQTGQKPPTSAYLLPGFDEYLLSYKDKTASMDVRRIRRLVPPNGMLPPTIVMNGQVAGTWKRTFKKDKVVIRGKPFARLSAADERALDEAGGRYGAFLERAVEMGRSTR